MKYLYYLFVFFTVVVRRLMFWMVFIAIPFRFYARNIVYNYHLQNGIKLKRLYERNPKKLSNGWSLKGGSHASTLGFVRYRKVSKVQYYFVMTFLWLWLDDDCNEDTYDRGFNITIVTGQRKKWMPMFVKRRLARAAENAKGCNIKGNSFDLGDKRAYCPLFEFWSVLLWSLRNPAYNFNYKFNQLTDESKAFRFVIFGRLFGWKEDGLLDGEMTYSWEFGKKIMRSK